MKVIKRLAVAAAAVTALLSLSSAYAGPGGADELSTKTITRAEFDKLFDRLSNIGRWGKDDQLGTLNLITRASRRRAVELVKTGKTISLERIVTNLAEFPYANVDYDGWSHEVYQGETYKFSNHGLAHTHLDALSHMLYRGKMYNGHEGRGLPSPSLGIERMKDGIFTRGILIDIPRLRGVPYLVPGTVIRCNEIDAWLRQARLKVAPGDALFIRTGRWAYRAQNGAGPNPDIDNSGLDLSCAEWMKDRGVSLLGSDFANEPSNAAIQKVWLDHAPFHILAIAALGMPLIDNCDLEALAREAAQQKKWEFLFIVSPIAVPGATGSAVNPLAVF